MAVGVAPHMPDHARVPNMVSRGIPRISQGRFADIVVDRQRLSNHGGRVVGAGRQQQGGACFGNASKGCQVLLSNAHAGGLIATIRPASHMLCCSNNRIKQHEITTLRIGEGLVNR